LLFLISIIFVKLIIGFKIYESTFPLATAMAPMATVDATTPAYGLVDSSVLLYVMVIVMAILSAGTASLRAVHYTG
jgi:hypothetical protein